MLGGGPGAPHRGHDPVDVVGRHVVARLYDNRDGRRVVTQHGLQLGEECVGALLVDVVRAQERVNPGGRRTPRELVDEELLPRLGLVEPRRVIDAELQARRAPPERGVGRIDAEHGPIVPRPPPRAPALSTGFGPRTPGAQAGEESAGPTVSDGSRVFGVVAARAAVVAR
ncbi:hypothetical protein DEA06_01845 [Microbacterium sp. Gd 4-13]|nr:hypothetical protein DEA06_01845 [Microbacterium sp. Gd 4-13]